MNDDQLARNLKSVGMSCFVKYYKLLINTNIDRTEIIERIKSENDYTERSCVSRVGHALSIIKSGRGDDALNLIVSSDSPRVNSHTRQLASSYTTVT